MALNKVVRNALADESVTSAKIEDGAITSGKLGAGTITLSKTPLGNAAPTISSLDTSVINPSSGATVTITGTGFVTMPEVKFMNTSTGVRVTPSSIGFTSSTTLTATFPASQTIGTYKVVVENPDGKGAISSSTILYSAAPTWSTAASLGSVEEGASVNISLLAYDDNSTAVSSYSLVSGSLPSGVTLSGDSSVGALTGTAPAVDADTQYTFTIRATDDENQTSDREFTLTVTNWQVANSLRFDDGSSDYLNITQGSGNRRTWTYSAWIKKASTGVMNTMLSVRTNNFIMRFRDDGEDLQLYEGDGTSFQLRTNRRFRDPSAWYHIVLAVDTTQGTSSNRIKLYVNGVQETSFQTSNYPSQNYDTSFNNSNVLDIGVLGSGGYWNGYMSEVCFIDGQQLTPSSFGETDTDSGIWIPKQISGLTFGTNGFYLPFTNSSSLGADSSGNSNNFTVNNLTSIDQTTDTPQNNYCTLNSLIPSANLTFSQGNLQLDTSGSDPTGGGLGTIGVSQGKWYWEVKYTSNPANHTHGIISELTNPYQTALQNKTGVTQYHNDDGGEVSVDGSFGNNNYGTLTTGDILGIAFNADDSQISFYKNGTALVTGFTISTTRGILFPLIKMGLSTTAEVNFGNPTFSISSGNSDANGYGTFEYAVPSGYFALNTKNLYQYG